MVGCRGRRLSQSVAVAVALAWAAACSEEPTEPPNVEPEAVGTIPAVSMFLGDTAVVAVSGYFSDPDGDALSYSAASSDAGVVTTSVSVDTIRLVAVGKGNATVTVTATDPEGLSAEQGLSVTVANRAPEPVDSMPALEVQVGETAALAVSDYFSDPDGDVLSYTAASSDRGVVTTSVSGDTLRVVAAAKGDATVTVTATDPGGLSAKQSLAVVVPDPERAILVEFYESTGGDGWKQKDNWLTDAPLGTWYGVSTNQAGVSDIFLSDNNLSGQLPARLGDLAGLKFLILDGNALSGSIPPELGQLHLLWSLDLSGNRLTGRIPAELGDFSRLIYLTLGMNELEGPIPIELANATTLINLRLQQNRLTGPIPDEFGKLLDLRTLWLSGNDLSGALPPELGTLKYMSFLLVSSNPKLAGVLPAELTALTDLRALAAAGTDLCAPSDSDFQAWLAGLEKWRVRICGQEPSPAYLVQSAQSRDFPVPLVAGKEALLRVFVTASKATSEGIPLVRAHFYLDGSKTYTATIPGKSTAIPTEVDEGSLEKSANAEIPARIVQPGLEMVVEVDPDGTLDDSLGVVKRIPEDGRLALEVDSMPTFELTVIPFLWESDPDSSVLEATEGMAEDEEEDELLFDTYDLLPMEEMEVSDHDPVESSTNNILTLIRQVDAIRRMEGGDGYYAGLMAGEITGAKGVAYIGGKSSFSAVEDWVIAHEFGHNLSLGHAPCGGPGKVDYFFPQPDGTTGSWGYDFRSRSLVSPGTFDHMSYCDPRWTGDYHFSKAFEYRASLSQNVELAYGPQQTILLWGGLDAAGTPLLEPAFVVDAPPALPGSPGPHSLTGKDQHGAELFSVSFEMDEIADGEGESASFVFLLPVQPGWAGALASITLSGPGGSVTLDGDTDVPMTIVRDTENGQVRAILTGARVPPPARSGLEVLLSRGIPARGEWER